LNKSVLKFRSPLPILLRRFRIWQINSLRALARIKSGSDFYLLLLASLIGMFTAFGAYLLNIIVNAVHQGLFNQAGLDLVPAEINNYLRIIYPAIGGLLVGLLTYHFSPEVKGHGIPGVMDAVANRGGHIRRRVALLTSLNSGTTIGSGGSAGKEGPIVQIGAAIGSGIGQLFHVSSQRLKILVGCGAAAGLASVFNAPIAGVVFAIEIILADFSLAVFTPIVISSVIATALSHYIIGSSPFLKIPAYALNSVAEFPLYLLMGILGGLVAAIFIKTLYGIEGLFETRLRLPVFIKPAIGGFLTGGLAFAIPELYGFDDSAIYTALTGRAEIYLLAILIVAKILATSFTLGSGGAGGLFTPSLFIGAMFGALFGAVAHTVFPSITAPPGAYALVGMGVIVAGTIHAPLSALLIIFEVTADYHIILPLMLSTVAASLASQSLSRESIYTMKISLFSSRTFRGRNLDILQTHSIQALIDEKAPCFSPSTGIDDVIGALMHSTYSSFPVIDEKRCVVGIVTMRDLQPVLFDRDVAPLLVAADFMSESIFFLEPSDTMAVALNKMEVDDAENLVVVEAKETMQYRGIVSREDILKRYAKENLMASRYGEG
jgi:CIC family chloride channel protein